MGSALLGAIRLGRRDKAARIAGEWRQNEHILHKTCLPSTDTLEFEPCVNHGHWTPGAWHRASREPQCNVARYTRARADTDASYRHAREVAKGGDCVGVMSAVVHRRVSYEEVSRCSSTTERAFMTGS